MRARLFFRSFASALLLLLLPLLLFAAAGAVYERTAGTLHPGATAFLLTDRSLILFDQEIPLDGLSVLARPGHLWRGLTAGIPSLGAALARVGAELLFF